MKKQLLVAASISAMVLGGCTMQPTKPDANVSNEIRSGDYGLALNSSSFSKNKKKIVNGILNQTRTFMVDPDSTKITSVQIKDFKKCVLTKIGSKPNSSTPKGYCVYFEYNSRNRMGGYGGSKAASALVHLERGGKVTMFAHVHGLRQSKDYSYPYTPETGVYGMTYFD